MDLDNFDTLIVEADPALDVAIPSAWSDEAQRFYRQLTARSLVPTRRKVPILLAASVLGTAAAVLAILIVTVLPGPSGEQSAAAAVFAQAATNTGKQTHPLGPDQYFYTKTRNLYQLSLYSPSGDSGTLAIGATAQVIDIDQVWMNNQGRGRILRTYGDLQFPSSKDRAEWNANVIGAHLFQTLLSGSRSLAKSQPEQALVNVSDLPTSTDLLKAVLASAELQSNIDLIPPGPNAVFERGVALLLGPVVGMSPALASGLFHVLASQPGIRLVGDVLTRSGQQGEAVVLPSSASGRASEVIMDPNSGSVLEATYASPPATIQPGGRVACVNPSNGSRNCTQQGARATLALMRTDVVSTGVVDSVSRAPMTR
jgi:hypothetical protein